MWGRSATATRSSGAASGCSSPGSRAAYSTAWRRLSVSTAGPPAQRRPRSRSWPRSWPCETAPTGGGFMQPAELGGRPLLEHALRVISAAPLSPTVVVLGSGAEDVLATVDLHGTRPV